MAAVWNIKDLHSPPNLTYEIRLSDIDADKFTSVCLDAISILNDQEALHAEAATLSRLLYRIKSKLRCDKGFKCMKKVNHGLLCYLSMDLATVFNAIKPSPCDNGYQTMCAPSRQMLEWVLVRTQGFARLFCQVMQTCRDAAIYMKCRLRLGHMWDIALISLGIVSRIWSISKYLVLCACGWYDKLKPYLDVLKPVGIRWLPADYHFPAELRAWLDPTVFPDLLKLDTRDSGNEKQHRIFDLIEFGNSKDEDALESSYGNEMEVLESNGAVLSSESANVTEENERLKKLSEREKRSEESETDVNRSHAKDSVPTKADLISAVEDVGEPVPSFILNPRMLPTRPRSVQKLVKPKNKDRSAERSELSSDQQIECIETALDLSKFLSKEDKLRKKSSGGSLTNRLDKLQWHMLRKTLCGLVRKLDSKSVVKGSDKYENIMKRAREEILLRIQ